MLPDDCGKSIVLEPTDFLTSSRMHVDSPDVSTINDYKYSKTCVIPQRRGRCSVETWNIVQINTRFDAVDNGHEMQSAIGVCDTRADVSDIVAVGRPT